MPSTFSKWLLDHPELYHAYSYSYPHKSAYRPLETPQSLKDVWANEDKSALFLYAHIPFCEMRCGFCNLFTMAKPKDDLGQRYVDTLAIQAKEVKAALGDEANFVRMAIGGGTPTQLETAQLAKVFEIMTETMGANPAEIPVSCEVSPETVTTEKLDLLKSYHVDRVSIGVQSFLEEETKAVRRPQKYETVTRVLDQIKSYDFRLFNLDLIYGIRGQTPESWAFSLKEAIKFEPEEIFLYPLYVRPLTGLGNSNKAWEDERVRLYRQGRDFLLANGYEQSSMRLFRRQDLTNVPAPDYVCQRDGMIGLGVGARSYTKGLHYSSDYAVGRRGVVSIIESYVERDAQTLSMVDYGVVLSPEEQKRRFVIISLLSHEGLNPLLYAQQFGVQLNEDFPQLDELTTLGLTVRDDHLLRLTPKGIEYSDAIGPWLYSDDVLSRMDAFELR